MTVQDGVLCIVLCIVCVWCVVLFVLYVWCVACGVYCVLCYMCVCVCMGRRPLTNLLVRRLEFFSSPFFLSVHLYHRFFIFLILSFLFYLFTKVEHLSVRYNTYVRVHTICHPNSNNNSNSSFHVFISVGESESEDKSRCYC
jgi:hypothetical protein